MEILRMTAVNRKKRLNELYDTYIKERVGKEIVVGDGKADAQILFIGEAPGRYEVEEGKPFQGAAGKNFEEMLLAAGLARKDIYITNAIKHRLSKPGARNESKVNRPAKNTDIMLDLYYLGEEIRIIKPDIIVPMGNIPLRALYMLAGHGSCPSMGTVHGRIIELLLHNKPELTNATVTNDTATNDTATNDNKSDNESDSDNDRGNQEYRESRDSRSKSENRSNSDSRDINKALLLRVFPLYHPASIIYNRQLKDILIDDCTKLMDCINIERGIDNAKGISLPAGSISI